MTKEAMYRRYAKYYDLVYTWKNYRKETEGIHQIIRKYKKSKGKELLEVACGTGAHITHMKKWYKCTGTDINPGILDIAKKKNSKIKFIRQDMTNLNINNKFDVITCLFSSIGYVRSQKALKNTFKRFVKHLKPGGVLIIEPWLTKDIAKKGYIHMSTYEDKEIKIACQNISDIKGNLFIMNQHWMVSEKGMKKPLLFVDDHILLMTPILELVKMSETSGLKTHLIKNKQWSRGLIIGVKP
ncbi:class I SAM-dependent methyltransferase [Candidatus Woesearchaeota archaeon]|nr:class I SAM-dependent methyltransferase [Candidatus Woesearchaeota archaeon]